MQSGACERGLFYLKWLYGSAGEFENRPFGKLLKILKPKLIVKQAIILVDIKC